MKTFSIILIFLSFSSASFSQTSKITGVVTYFFNKYQGDKPDIGAEVYVLDSVETAFDYQMYKRFHSANFNRSLLSSYLKMKEENDAVIAKYGKKRRYASYVQVAKSSNSRCEKNIDEFRSELANLGINTDEDFERLDKEHFDMLLAATNTDKLDNILKRKVDGVGNYSINVNPGVYYVIIRSNNRKDIFTSSQVMGKIYCKKVTVKENSFKDVSYNFSAN